MNHVIQNVAALRTQVFDPHPEDEHCHLLTACADMWLETCWISSARACARFSNAVRPRIDMIQMTVSSVPSLNASLHTSAPALESKRKRASRLRRQKNQAQQSIKQRMFEMSAPDPVLAHRLNDEGRATWENSELAKLILTKTEVWGLMEDRRGRLQKVEPTPRAEEDAQIASDVATYGGPRRLNFGLDTSDRRTLFQSLPRVMTTDRAQDLTYSSLAHEGSDAMAQDLAQLESEQAQSAETLGRILDLRNASGKGIQVENTRRIIAHFGRSTDSGSPDTGSPEVQGMYLVCDAGNETGFPHTSIHKYPLTHVQLHY